VIFVSFVVSVSFPSFAPCAPDRPSKSAANSPNPIRAGPDQPLLRVLCALCGEIPYSSTTEISEFTPLRFNSSKNIG
jgi:hypothetical protein